MNPGQSLRLEYERPLIICGGMIQSAEDTGVPCEQCVMIGDTEYDARGAKGAGVPFIGVGYGFGDRDEILRCPCIGFADKPMDVLQILDEKMLISPEVIC